MKIGFVGLGRMGNGMVRRLLKHGIEVVVFDRAPAAIKELSKPGAEPASSIRDLVQKLPRRKIVWLMLPAGKPTDETIRKFSGLLGKGDILIDGANDYYKNAQRHSSELKRNGILFLDCGVSGGIYGDRNGYTLMIGGPKDGFAAIEPVCKALAPEQGYAHFGKSGAGHFVKSVHNIIEYVYLEGLAEGYELLSNSELHIDPKKALKVWKPASVIRSWLLDLAVLATDRPGYENIEAEIMSVTSRELMETASDSKHELPAFKSALRIRSDKSKRFASGKRLIAAIRNEFGGHAVKRTG